MLRLLDILPKWYQLATGDDHCVVVTKEEFLIDWYTQNEFINNGLFANS